MAKSDKNGDRKVGPRKTCPACATEDVSPATYCYPENRAFLGGMTALKKFFTNGTVLCEKEGRHLHQKCNVCGCSWTGTPVEIK